jgi:NADH dehydrogenase
MVLVAGSTGMLGSEICRRLRQRGEPVRALVRETSDPRKVDALRALGCSIVVGDLKDPPSLDVACRDVDVVISTVTAITTAKAGDSFDATDARGNMDLVDAAKRAGVRQFIYVSFQTDTMPDAPLVLGKRAAERHLASSGLEYTILQPSLFMEIWLGPMLFADPVTATAKVYGNRDVRFRYVSVADVAEVAVQCVNNPAVRNAVVPFGGPEPLTQRDAVRLFEQGFGKAFAVTEIPEGALEAQFASAQDPWAASFSGLMLGVSRGGAPGDVLRGDCFDVAQTSVSDFVARLRSASA